MRLARISKLVSKAGLCDVYGDEHGTGVYISVGKAIYHVQDLPMPCARDQMGAMLDIPSKKWEKVSCTIQASLPPLDMQCVCPGEVQMAEYNLLLGSKYLILTDAKSNGKSKEKGRLAFVSEELLAPVLFGESEYLGYYCRFMADGAPYIIIKDGMYTVAAVVPTMVPVAKVAEQLARLESMCLDEAERNGGESSE